MNEKAAKLYELISTAAQEHGEDDDPDHEVGDLQEALSMCLASMTDEQLTQLEIRWKQSQE